MRKSLKERIEKHQWKRRGNVCWPWLGYIDDEGHGRIWVSEQEGSVIVGTALWKELGRPIEPGQKVLACPILKDCSNPNHISVGNSTDIGDRILWKKKLKRRIVKEKVPIERKLSDEQVRQIYLSTAKNTELAEQYHVTAAMISQIRSGKRYRRITESLGEQT